MSKPHEPPESAITEPLREALERRAAGLDSHSLRRLRVARGQAIAAASARPDAWRQASLWAGAGSVALVLLGAALLYFRQANHELPGLDADSLEIIASEDELELYENLDFYDWLQHHGDDPA